MNKNSSLRASENERGNLKHSGVEWLGQIPKHWEIVPMKRLFYISKKENLNPNPNILSLTFGGIIERDISKGEGQWAKSYIGYNIVEKDDIIFNPLDLLAGYVAKSNFNGVISPAYTLIKPLKNLNMDYYERLFQNWYHQKVLYHLGKGVSHENRWTLTTDVFLDLPVLLPPLNEQRQIAEFLDKQCEKISEFIAKKQRLITLLKEQKQTLINECVCGRLDFVIESERSEVSPSLRDFATQNRGNPQKTTTKGIDCHEVVPTSRNDKIAFKHSGVEWLGQIPKHWEVKRLRFLGQIFAGLSNKTGKDFFKEYNENTQPYIPFTNIAHNFIIDENQMEFVKISCDEIQNEVKKDDILFLMSSETCEEVGKNSIYKGNKKVYLNSFCKGFRVSNLKILNPYFLNYLWSSLTYQRYFIMFGRGFTRINLRQEYILDLPVLLPPLNEQRQIAEFLDKQCEKIDKAIRLIEQEINKMKEYKTSLIDKAVKGQINA